MSSSWPRPRLVGSVFFKLLAIMLAMAVSLLVLVAGFFGWIVSPELDRSVHLLVGEYAQAVAATSPDLEAARGMAARLNVEIRYEGPRGSWTTAPDLPTIEQARERKRHPPALGADYVLAPAQDGGTYLFFWNFHRRMGAIHTKLLWLLLTLILTVVVVAHAVLRRALRPLRLLHDGVTRMSQGDLDVALAERTHDEFGVLTDAFNEMARRVKEMVRARDQLLLDVSHELRSPLTRMRVALALLPEGEKQRRMTADVAEMEAMITELLELERLRQGRGIRAERQDLLSVAREAAQAFQDRPPGVRVVTAEKEVLLDFDLERVRIVLRNVLENAIKYSRPESQPVEVKLEADDETVTVRVRDDGHGLGETDLGRLFEPFYRLDPSRSKKTGGYGLGLSMCQRIMEAHGGTITAENNAGSRGATLTLTFRRRA